MVNKTIWQKLKNNIPIGYSDIENYIYTKEYIKAMADLDYNFNGKEYNESLYRYFFEVEDYIFKEDYKEVFFQSYLDGDISKESYKYYENKFIMMMKTLFNSSTAFVFYTLEIPLENNLPAQSSKDVLKDIEKIKMNSNKIIAIKDWDFFEQICYMALREIDCVCFLFADIQAVLIHTGMHGCIFSAEPLSKNLQDKLSKTIHIKPINTRNILF